MENFFEILDTVVLVKMQPFSFVLICFKVNNIVYKCKFELCLVIVLNLFKNKLKLNIKGDIITRNTVYTMFYMRKIVLLALLALLYYLTQFKKTKLIKVSFQKMGQKYMLHPWVNIYLI